MRNQSVPLNTVLPHLYYWSVADAAEWLARAFGLKSGEPWSRAEGEWN
jgi:hypothetical protein